MPPSGVTRVMAPASQPASQPGHRQAPGPSQVQASRKRPRREEIREGWRHKRWGGREVEVGGWRRWGGGGGLTGSFLSQGGSIGLDSVESSSTYTPESPPCSYSHQSTLKPASQFPAHWLAISPPSSQFPAHWLATKSPAISCGQGPASSLPSIPILCERGPTTRG